MKGKKVAFLISVLPAVMLVGWAVFPSCQPAEPEVYELKVQSAWPHGDLSIYGSP